VSWTWPPADAKTLPIGSYRYRFGWRDGAGERYWLPDRSLEVIRRVMQRTLTFERQSAAPWPSAARPILILDHDRGQRQPPARGEHDSSSAGDESPRSGN
jgi:hypothetical protein